MLDITIGMITYNDSKYLLNNINILRKSLDNINHEFLIIANTKKDYIRCKQDPLLRILDYDPIPKPKGITKGGGSWQHGLSLNKLLQHVKETKYILLLDADFFIMYSMKKVIELLSKEHYVFFGAPYLTPNPKYIKNFPVAYCLFIDTTQVNISTLDFTPSYGKYKDKTYSTDTGYQLYYKFLFREYVKYDIVLPSTNIENIRRTNNTINNRYNLDINKNIQLHQFFLGNDLFGVHCRKKKIEFQSMYLKEINLIYKAIQNENKTH